MVTVGSQTTKEPNKSVDLFELNTSTGKTREIPCRLDELHTQPSRAVRELQLPIESNDVVAA